MNDATMRVVAATCPNCGHHAEGDELSWGGEPAYDKPFPAADLRLPQLCRPCGKWGVLLSAEPWEVPHPGRLNPMTAKGI